MILMGDIENYRVLAKHIDDYMLMYETVVMAIYPGMTAQSLELHPRPQIRESWQALKSMSRTEGISLLRTWLQREGLLVV
jgi:hypothetical protein